MCSVTDYIFMGVMTGLAEGKGTYPAYIACNLYPKKVLGVRMPFAGPYMTQEGKDREENPNQYIRNITSGSLAGFKYFRFDGTNRKLEVTLRGHAKGVLYIRTSEKGKNIGRILIDYRTDTWQKSTGKMEVLQGKKALYFTYHGKGYLDMFDFTLK